jgi:hypothetical protein
MQGLYLQGAAHEIGKQGTMQLSRLLRQVAKPCLQLTPAVGLLLLAIVLAGCQTTANSPSPSLYEQINLSSMRIHAKRARSARAAKSARTANARRVRATKGRAAAPAAINYPARGLELLGKELRLVLFQERLRGLCEVVRVDQLSGDLWHANCAKGGAFVVKVYPEGYLSVTRS